jgi:hypothetical protein
MPEPDKQEILNSFKYLIFTRMWECFTIVLTDSVGLPKFLAYYSSYISFLLLLL